MVFSRASGIRISSKFRNEAWFITNVPKSNMVHYKRSKIKHGLLQTFRNVPTHWYWIFQGGTFRKVCNKPCLISERAEKFVMNHASFRNLEAFRIPEALVLWPSMKACFQNTFLHFSSETTNVHLTFRAIVDLWEKKFQKQLFLSFFVFQQKSKKKRLKSKSFL